MLPNFALFLILLLILLLVLFVLVYFIFFHRKLFPHPISSNSNNVHCDNAPTKPEKLVEVPLQDPIEPGPKPMKSDFADSQSTMQLLLLLESAFDEAAGKANISKVKEFFGPQAQTRATGTDKRPLMQLNKALNSSSSEELLVNFLKANKNLYISFFDKDHSALLGPFFGINTFFLHHFYYPDIFDPKEEFELSSKLELEVLEKVLIDVIKCRHRETIDQNIPFIETLDIWKDFRLFINNHPSQRRLLSQLCFICFDGLNDLSFQSLFSEFLYRPRASPRIANNRLVMVHFYADQIVSLIVEHQLISRSSLSSLNECSSTQSEKEYTCCLDRIKVKEIIPIKFIKGAILSKFPLWPNSWFNYELSFLAPKLFERINHIPQDANKNLPFEGIHDNCDMNIFGYFQVKHFSLGLLNLLKNFVCKYNYTSPNFDPNSISFKFSFGYSFELNWKKCFSPESEFVYPLAEIDKLFDLYSSSL